MAGKDVIANGGAVIVRKRILGGFTKSSLNKKTKLLDNHLIELVKEEKIPAQVVNPWGIFMNRETFTEMHLV